MTVDWLHKLTESGLSQKQAEAIASMPEERYVTRDYFDAKLDARISALETSLTWRMLTITGLAIAIITLVDKFVRP